MKKYRSLSTRQSEQEIILGWVYFLVQLLVLPSLLVWGNTRAGRPFSEAELNFTFFSINFAAVLWIFHRFLSGSFRQVRVHPAYFCQAVILGLAAYYSLFYFVRWIVSLLVPGFTNYNDAAISNMSHGGYFLMAISTVILVPPAEECVFRGLIFRNLYGKSRWAAYAVSMAAFACVHILGYVGRYSPLELLMAVLEYLPAGLSLAWAYAKSDTIFAPILMHACINFVAMGGLR